MDNTIVFIKNRTKNITIHKKSSIASYFYWYEHKRKLRHFNILKNKFGKIVEIYFSCLF